MFGVTPVLPIRFTCYEKCFKGNDEVPDHRVTLQGKALAYYVPLELQPINQSNSFNTNKKNQTNLVVYNFKGYLLYAKVCCQIMMKMKML